MRARPKKPSHSLAPNRFVQGQHARGLYEGFLIALCPIGTYPPGPRYSLRFVVGYACACEEGGTVSGFARGLREGGLGFYGVIHSLKAIRAT